MTILTIPEAAQFLKVSVDVIYELVRSEKFPSVKVGGQWRIPLELLEQWVSEQALLKHS